MDIFIEINYIGWESDIIQNGSFPVNNRKFKNDPDWAAAEVALQRINQIRMI